MKKLGLAIAAVTTLLASETFAALDRQSDPWIGISPATLVNGQTLFDAASYGHASNLLHSYDWDLSTRWSIVSVINVPPLGMRAYYFTECMSPGCTQGSWPPIQWVVMYKWLGQGVNVFRAFLSETRKLTYCGFEVFNNRVSMQWTCFSMNSSQMPTGSPAEIAGKIQDGFLNRLNQPRPTPQTKQTMGKCHPQCSWHENWSNDKCGLSSCPGHYECTTVCD